MCAQTPSLPVNIESETLVDYVENGLTAHFFTPMLQDLSQRQKLGAQIAVSIFYLLTSLLSCVGGRLAK